MDWIAISLGASFSSHSPKTYMVVSRRLLDQGSEHMGVLQVLEIDSKRLLQYC